MCTTLSPLSTVRSTVSFFCLSVNQSVSLSVSLLVTCALRYHLILVVRSTVNFSVCLSVCQSFSLVVMHLKVQWHRVTCAHMFMYRQLAYLSLLVCQSDSSEIPMAQNADSILLSQTVTCVPLQLCGKLCSFVPRSALESAFKPACRHMELTWFLSVGDTGNRPL